MLKMSRPPLRSFRLRNAVLALAAALLAFAPIGAQADGWHGHGHGHGHAYGHYRYWGAPVWYGGFFRPGFYGPRVVYAPPAYYVAPPVYYAPPPPPAYYAPAPVYGYGPPGVSLQLGVQLPLD
jgi:hypothetical protein